MNTPIRAGLIGSGIAQSRTPGMHMAEGASLGLSYTYEVIDSDDRPGVAFADLLAAAEDKGLAGVNVTYPFKQIALQHVDHAERSATMVGATNTIVFQNGKRVAHNTDVTGFSAAFRSEICGTAPIFHVLLVGAGGAGAAVAHALMDCGVTKLSVLDRDVGAARDLVCMLTELWGDGRADVALHPADVTDRVDGIVNATPMGMAKLPGTAIDLSLIAARHWVADVVYFPLQTALLAGAAVKGCRVMNGAGMAVGQAVDAFVLFTGRPADPVRMRAHFDSLA